MNLLATDWVGISTCIGALTAGVVAIIGALAALQTKRQIQTGNGRTIGQAVVDAKTIAGDTNAKVTSISNGETPVAAVLPPVAG